MARTADVVIGGAGVIGGSIAFHLLERDPGLPVVMLEKEPEPGTGATSKATGGVRFQFSTEVNVRLSQLSYPYFAQAEEILGSPVDFLRHGYLFEIVLDGRASSMDIDALSLDRFAAGRLRAEANMF